MAKQSGNIKIIGTIDDISFYKSVDGYLARKKSSLDGKRYKKEAAFEGSRRSNERLVKSQEMASKLYRSLPEEERKYIIFKTLRTLGYKAFKEGKKEKQVLQIMKVWLNQFKIVEAKIERMLSSRFEIVDYKKAA